MIWMKNQKIKYVYTDHSNNIDLTPPKPNSQKAWNYSKHSKLKEKIKLHHSYIQDDMCAYCRQPIKFEGYGEPIEHIIPKSKKYRWMFHPKNVCLSCYGCNTKKGTKNPLAQSFANYGHRYIDLPQGSIHYKIIHPHYDSYSNHLYEEKFICKVKNGSNKGTETMKMCDLNRLEILYTRARRKNTSHKQLRKILAMVLIDTSFTLEERQTAQNMIYKIIARYKYLKDLPNN